MPRVLLTVFLVLLAPALARAQVSSESMVAREIAMLEFVGGGSPLTPGEREQAAAVVQEGMRLDPKAWTELDAQHAQALQAANRASPAQVGAVRLNWRLGAAKHNIAAPDFAPLADAERRILDAHDPVLYLDAAHGWLVTAHTVQVLAQALPGGAKALGLPPPAPGAAALMAERAPEFLPQLQEQGHDAFTRAEQVLPLALAGIKDRTAQNRAALHDGIAQVADVGTRDLQIARIMVLSGRQVAEAGGAGGRTAAGMQRAMMMQFYSQFIMQPMINRTIRGMGSTCRGDSLGNVGYCSGN
jgi:hypothetical protein